MGISLSALSGVPPSPMFLSELLILLGGMQAGEVAIAALAAIALALAFLGLLHALIEGVIGPPRPSRRRGRHHGEHAILAMTLAACVGLLALTVVGLVLPGSAFVAALAKGAL
jgi:formate hydrogenlyase subunit 3/multisubunit Na+/H+ antiporter MnhD subunit